VGAGTGATLGRFRGPEGRRPGGLGMAQRTHGDLVVGAVVAVNAVGDLTPAAGGGGPGDPVQASGAPTLEGTTIGVVVTNAHLDKLGCYLVAQSCHDGLARALDPAHTSGDGDAMVTAAVGGAEAPVDRVRVLAAYAVEAAVRAVAG
jgi:L-aminopeptidase/D-esterase-like protein